MRGEPEMPERDLFELLRRRLPAEGKVLLLGWPDGCDLAAGVIVVRAANGGDLARVEGGLAAIVWRLDPASGGDSAATLARLGERLAPGGLVVLAVPVDGVQEALPRDNQGGLREVVRLVSEAGWCLQRDETAGGYRVLSLRPDAFTVRSYRDGDEGAILELFTACFPHARRGVDHWRWKYRDAPGGRHLISLAVAAGGRLAAHYGGYPVPYSLVEGGRRREVLAMQMADTMTHPDFRHVGRGRSALLPRTVRHFFARHRDRGFDFFFGFNTGPIQRFCQWFIGGFLVEPVGFWTRSAAAMPPRVRRYRVETVERLDGGWDRFFRRAADHYGSLVRRDAAYLAWRYLSCPDGRFVLLSARRLGRLAGWSVFRRDGDRLLWGDCLVAPDAAGAEAALLEAALAHPRLAGASRVETWSPPRPVWWETRLRRLGFAPEPHPQGLGMVALANGGVATAELLRASYYAMGDGDLF